MARKNKNDYFKLMEEQVAVTVEAAGFLEKIICSYSIDEIHAQRDEMHKIERRGDDIHHDIVTKLRAEFITPIDQEDILLLVQIIDDITDAIEEVVQNFYMFHVKQVMPCAVKMAIVVNRCVTAFSEAVAELKNFKKPEALKGYLQQVNLIESEADNIYSDSIYELFGKGEDAHNLISRKVIYESMEACCDLCEDAADIIEQIVIKNT